MLTGTAVVGRFGHAIAKANDLNGDLFDGMDAISNLLLWVSVSVWLLLPVFRL